MAISIAPSQAFTASLQATQINQQVKVAQAISAQDKIDQITAARKCGFTSQTLYQRSISNWHSSWWGGNGCKFI